MTKLSQPVDQNFLVRWLHLHCFIHMFKVITSKDTELTFSKPRFEMFKPIRRLFSSKTTSNSLFKNIVFTYKQQIIVGFCVTLIYACLNLLVPQIIKAFLTEMQGYGLKKKVRYSQDSYFTESFILLQFLRLLFGEHSKRLFNQLAIKVESTLSKRLIEKSLKMAKQCTDRFPQSQIHQLQNVDLRLIFNLFKNLHLCFQAPITVLGALLLLFIESPSYGLIGIYWFIIAFFLQRQLDGRMAHCNATKLKLIDKRSQVNYEIFKKIKAAKLAFCQDLIIQKNNDLFIHQNHDHQQYYLWSTLYDITLLLLPVMVVITVALYDIGEANPITVEEMYVMLSLIQICINPMKSIQTITISFHDGLHSLGRLTTYFALPDQLKSALINRVSGDGSEPPELEIKKNTISAYPHSSYDFWLIINIQLQLEAKERLLVVGKKGQGISSFVHMLIGSMKKIKGNVFLSGKIAYLPQKFIFSSTTVKQNITFYNSKNIQDEQVRNIYNRLGLREDIKISDGLSLMMNKEEGFTPSQLQKISLARIFCSSANIYILDSPFNHLSSQSCQIVQGILREKQQQGVMVIMAVKHLDLVDPMDQVLILDEGVSVEYGKFKDLATNPDSRVLKFFKNKSDDELRRKERKNMVINQFKKRVHRAMSINRVLEKLATSSETGQQTQTVKVSQRNSSQNQRINSLQKKFQMKHTISNTSKKGHNFLKYLYMFLSAASPAQTILVYLIIIAAELLHIFIHFFIGHEYEEHQNNDLVSFRNLLLIELVLTIGLASILYLEGEVSSKIAVIKGNRLYSSALKRLADQSQTWFSSQFSIKLADKFNHDYQQVFIVWHNILAIYKNLIILIATIYFVSANKNAILIILFFISTIYISVMLFLRSVETKVISYYYEYKYEFVKVFEESITSSEFIRIYDVKAEFMERAKQNYMSLAAYKLAQSYTAYGQEILCDIISIILLGFSFEYSREMKMHGRGTAVIATSIFLLMNLSEVLKAIVKLTVNVQTFFSLNMEPFMEFAQQNPELDPDSYQGSKLFIDQQKNYSDKAYDIVFRNVVLQYQSSLGKINQIQKNPLSLQIPEGDKILLLEKNDIAKEYLVLALTRNLPQFRRKPMEVEGSIEIGGKKINEFTTQQLRKTIGVITEDNFYFNGTLKENISWNVQNFDQFQADLFARQLQIEQDFQNYKENKLESKIESVEGAVNSELNKKIALLRILCIKPKIVVIKDTPSFLGQRSMVQIIQNHIPKCTIIKISKQVEVSFDMDRIALMENLNIKQQGHKNDLTNMSASMIGRLLKQSNIDGYLYSNMASVSPRKYKSRASTIGFA